MKWLAIYLAPSAAWIAGAALSQAASAAARQVRAWRLRLHQRHLVWQAQELTHYSLADDVEDWLRRDANAELMER